MSKQIGFKIFSDVDSDKLEEKLNDYIQDQRTPDVIGSQVTYAEGKYTVLLTVDGFIGQEII